MFGLFRKLTREEKILKRSESVYAELTGESELEFTDLETVQIINNVRRRLSENLEYKKDSFMEDSVVSQQNAKEISNCLDYLI